MDVFVDGKSGHPAIADGGNPFEMVCMLSESLRAEGRAIVSVKADGTAIQPEEMQQRLSGDTGGGVARLDVETEHVATLLSEALQELESVLPGLAPACHSLAEVFQSGQPEDGIEPFHQLATIWRNIKQRQAEVLNFLDVTLDELSIGGKTLTRMHKELNTYLEEAVDAFKNRDYVSLGDLLEFELAPRAEAECDIVALLKEQAPAVQ